MLIHYPYRTDVTHREFFGSRVRPRSIAANPSGTHQNRDLNPISTMELQQALKDFYNLHQGVGLFQPARGWLTTRVSSTMSMESRHDPKLGQAWKGLLKKNGIDGNCYVTHPPAKVGSTHPKFVVGGHMTPNKAGKVKPGGICDPM